MGTLGVIRDTGRELRIPLKMIEEKVGDDKG